MINTSNSNILRNLTSADFLSEINFNNITKIAIVGGTRDDPEAILIRNKFPNILIKTYGIDDNQIFMDLNKEPQLISDFDLVICVNVIEHVFNHNNFSKNLLSIMKRNGILWLVFPFNDMYHGSPEYFSAGFHPNYVSNLFKNNGGITSKSKIISSKRLYLFTHFLKDWPSEFRFNHPLLGQITWGFGLRGNPRPPLKNLSLSKLIKCFILQFTSNKFNSDPNFGCGAWVKIIKSKTPDTI